ncbi:MAG TPA: acyl carrier protein [Methanofastidiosum sp.]|nr:acyl carrier protein [Methanofastidiosum sp.]
MESIENILERIAVIFERVFKVDKNTVTIKTIPDHIGKWDSISHLNMILEVEAEFNIRIDPSKFKRLNSVEKIINEIKFLKDKNGKR